MASNLRASWAESQARQAEDAEEELRLSRAEIGAAHREADNLAQTLSSTDDAATDAALQRNATRRGDEALRKIVDERRKEKEEEEKRKVFRQRALAQEQERAKRIAQLPQPSTGEGHQLLSLNVLV